MKSRSHTQQTNRSVSLVSEVPTTTMARFFSGIRVNPASLCIVVLCALAPDSIWAQPLAPDPVSPSDHLPPVPAWSEDFGPFDRLLDGLDLDEGALSEPAIEPAASQTLDKASRLPQESTEMDWEFIESLEMETRLRNESLLKKRSAAMQQWLQRSRALLPTPLDERPAQPQDEPTPFTAPLTNPEPPPTRVSESALESDFTSAPQPATGSQREHQREPLPALQPVPAMDPPIEQPVPSRISDEPNQLHSDSKPGPHSQSATRVSVDFIKLVCPRCGRVRWVRADGQ